MFPSVAGAAYCGSLLSRPVLSAPQSHASSHPRRRSGRHRSRYGLLVLTDQPSAEQAAGAERGA